MNNIGSTNGSSNVFAVMLRMAEDSFNDATEIAEDISHNLDLKSVINDMKQFLRNGDVDKFLSKLSSSPELKDLFGDLPDMDKKVVDSPPRVEWSTENGGLFGMGIPTPTFIPEESHMEYSDEAIDGMKDRLDDMGDELGQINNQQNIRLQLANQREQTAYKAASNESKSKHDTGNALVANLKA